MLETQRSEKDVYGRPDSIMLGEEAGSNKINLYYENLCHQLEKQKGKDSLKAPKIELRRAKTDFLVLPKSALSKASLQESSSRPGSNLRSAIRLPTSRNPLLIAPPIVRPKKNTSIRYSAREKLVIDW